jgi:long-subunit fatty acid transport protein
MAKKVLPASLAALLATGALAAGIDQSRQEIDLLFEEGDYARVGAGYWMPAVEGTDAFGSSSGNVYRDVPFFGLGAKKQFGPRWSAALILDQPWGVDLDYPSGDFATAGTSAQVTSLGLTGLARYRIGESFSLHGGVRATRLGADVGLDGLAFGNMGYRWDGDPGWGLGVVAGGAYEIPAIALRVALTWSSETRHELDSTETLPAGLGLPPELRSQTEVTMPQSVNLDFQTGVAPKTLVYGSVRWVNWKDWTVAPEGFARSAGT